MSLTAGARLVDAPDGAALHQRLSLTWRPASQWMFRVTDGTLQPTALTPGTAADRRFRGMEVQTERAVGSLHVNARAACQQMSDGMQSQVLHPAAVMLSLPLAMCSV